MGQQDFTQWQPSYSVGNWVLNNQHRVLLEFCRQSIDCLPDDRQGFTGPFAIIRDDFIDAVDEHFRTEEKLLQFCAYPLLAQHRDEHARARRQLADFLMAVSREEANQRALHDFLADWWFHHLLDGDKQFAGAIQRVR